jgi:integrase
MTKKKTPEGECSIISRSDRLLLRIPRQVFADNRQQEISLRMADSQAGRTVAAQILADIQLDIYQGKFDPSLEKYRRSKVVTAMTAFELWTKYLEYKKPTIKLSTLDYYERAIGLKVRDIKPTIDKALDVRNWLLKNTTQKQASRILDHLGSAVAWGLRHGEISLPTNPYLGMGRELKPKTRPPGPNAFTPEQKEQILNAFVGSHYYDHYFAFVYFLFQTGCRPSEAIGMRWGDIATDFSVIHFTGSIVQVHRKTVRVELSKTNRVRSLPVNDELRDLLKAIVTPNQKTDWLLFPLNDDPYLPINYDIFYKRAWKSIVTPIVNKNTTPYSCRDTFITEQIAAGFPISVISKWVDNSPRMISDRYFDISAVSFIPK